MYMVSENNNFRIIDTIGVPHPFCITHRHVAYASDHCSGMLSKEAIKESGAPCGLKGCNLALEEHEQAILIKCKADITVGGICNKELHRYLLALKGIAEQGNFAGFAFKKHSSLVSKS